MEVHLKPARFDVDPTSPTAAQEWTHWHTTMENFITAMKVTNDKEKQLLLINFVSPTVFSYISDIKSYTEAIAALKDIYNKDKNTLYSRHLLVITKQQDNQTLDDTFARLNI